MHQLQIDEVGGERTVMIEDDGRTAYAYLMEVGDVVSDVWLYNRDGVDDDPSWDDPQDMPFANKREFIRPETFVLKESNSVRADWDRRGVDLYVDNVRTARLERGAKPGWSRLARVAGPLAQPLESYKKA